MLVRDLLYDEDSFLGAELDLPYQDCPCRPCYILSRFPQGIACYTQTTNGCPPNSYCKPTHIIYQENSLQRKAKCLRCGIEIDLEGTGYEIMLVSTRDKKKICPYLTLEKVTMDGETASGGVILIGRCSKCGQWTSYRFSGIRICKECLGIRRINKHIWW